MGSRLTSKGVGIPTDIKVEQLSPDQERGLIGLKRWIRERQRKAVAEKRRAEKKAAEAARQESYGMQTSLFEALQV